MRNVSEFVQGNIAFFQRVREAILVLNHGAVFTAD